MIIQLLLSLLFIVLGMIHFNWAVGGKFGFNEALPTKENGERVLKPRKIDSMIVGIGLTSFGVFYLFTSGLIEFRPPSWLVNYLVWIIPVIFFFRAIGEFKYVGFFKKIKNTEFGKWDSKLFSPLCLVIAILGILANFIN